MAKADGKTSKSPEELPLDDPRWIRVGDLHCVIAVRLGDILAEKDITDRLWDGSLPCMKRRVSRHYPPNSPERELVPTEFLLKHRVQHSREYSGSGGATIVNLGTIFARDRWYEYFVWEPKAAEIWPDVFASTSQSKQQELEPVTNPRGAGSKQKFDREFILIEAAAYVAENDLPSSLEDLVGALQLILGDKMAGDTQGKNILRPFFRRVKQALGRR
jgi:hypothetical protein